MVARHCAASRVVAVLAACLFVPSFLISPASAEDEGGQWKSLFDGETLENWDGNPNFWSVEDGAITGQTTKDNPTKGNTFIVYRGGDIADFELKLEYRIIGGNSGIQYRSFEVDPEKRKWVIGGYQADIDSGKRYSGINYGEKFRGILADRGQHVVISEDGKKKVLEQFGDQAELQKNVKPEEWNDYHIIAKGNHFVHKINGVKMSELTDKDRKARDSGLLALQLHAGPPMKVQFRNIRIKRLGDRKSAAVDDTPRRSFAGIANVKDSQPKRVAFVAGTRSHGYGSHEHRAGSILLAKKLGEAMPNVDTVVHVNGWPQNPEALDGFDCIVMYCDGGGRHMVNDHLEQVDRYAKQGVGIVCIHYGVEVPKGKSGEKFLDWIGGYFETNWSVNPHWTATFDELPDHPTTNGVKPFSTNDEWYFHMRFREGMKGVTPILTDLPPESTLVKPDGSLARPDNAHNNNPHVREAVLEREEPQHVAWAATRPDGGRGFGFTGGHYHWNWGNPHQLKLVLNAITWCAQAEVPEKGVPASEVTLEELKANQDYDPKPNFNFDRIRDMLDEWNGRKTLSMVPAGKPQPVAEKKAEKDPGQGLLYRSPVVNDSTKGHAVDIDVDLKGADKVFLVVSDAGDGYSCDWADWVDPRFVGSKKEISLTELKWKSASTGYGQVNVNKNCRGNQARVAGKPVDRCIGTHANSVIAYDVPDGVTHIKARGALDDGGTNQGCGSTVRFAVYSKKPAGVAAPAGSSGSHDREDALAQLDIAKGLQASLFAAEPLMSNPTNIDIDHLGRVWVCEVINYRRFRNKELAVREGGDRILILEDTDLNGEADSVKVFYQGQDVNSAHGICVLPAPDGKGTKVLISCGDRVFYLIDDDGDLKADRKEILFTGISGTQHDHGIHAFVFGPDGRLYFNFGNAGKQLKDKNGKPIIDVAGNKVDDSRDPYQQGMVFRCYMDGSEVDTLGWNFRNNWEVCVDSFGTLWQSDNDDDGNRGTRINYVMQYGNYGYRDEFTGAGWRDYRTGWHEKIPQRHWHLNDPGVIPNLLQTGAGSPTGIMIYEGEMLPEPFPNEVIHCDAGPNIVRAYPAEKDGAGYSAYIQNLLHGARDKWYRPSDVCAAPDGSLIIADWYDPGVGGHRMQDVERGRLFRVATPGVQYSVPEVDVSTIAGAIEALKSPNLATRYMAWQKLHNEGVEAKNALTRLFENSPNPRYRARALWLLGAIKGNAEAAVQRAITDRNEDIRVTGVRLARQQKLDLVPAIRDLLADTSPVRRECAIALRFLDSPDKANLWAQLATQHNGVDRWYLEALGVGAHDDWDACMDALRLAGFETLPKTVQRDIVWRSRASQTPKLLAELIKSAATPEHELPRLFRAFDFQRGESRKEELLDLAFAYTTEDKDRQHYVNSEAVKRLDPKDISRNKVAGLALSQMLDRLKGTSEFVELVRQFGVSERYPALVDLAAKHPEEQLGVDAVTTLLARQQQDLLKKTLTGENEEHALNLFKALEVAGDGRAVGMLMSIVRNEENPVEIQRRAASAAASARNGAQKLIAMAKNGELDPTLKPAVAARLHASSDQKIRQQAQQLFPLPPTKNAKPLPPIPTLAKKRGDAERGKKIFDTTGTCSKCHKVNGQGKEVGPDLSEIGKKLSRTAMYESILFPSAGVSHNYETWSALTTEGNVVTGLLMSRTDQGLTIRTEKGIDRTIPSDQIEQLRKQKISLMPADIQKLLTQQDLVDVVEYLTTLKKKKQLAAGK